MIKKSLFIAIVLIFLHAGFVLLKPINNSQNQWQENIIKTQQFLYGKDDSIKYIIVGSSLSDRLVMDSLRGVYNLSLVGLGVYDGLNILIHKKISPRIIFIEMNMIIRDESSNFSSSIFIPILYDIRKYFPSFREEYQPIGQLYKVYLKFEKKKNTSINFLVNKNNSERNTFLKKLIQNQKQECSIKPKKDFMDKRFSKLKKYVTILEMKGVQIVFFEMPINKELYDLALARNIREYFFITFPPNKYHYINSPDCKDYLTSDGMHLPPDEALRYTSYLNKQINIFIKK